MIYRIVSAPGCHYPSRWLIEKITGGGENYLVASFREEGPAIAMLTMLASSTEVERGARMNFGSWSTQENGDATCEIPA